MEHGLACGAACQYALTTGQIAILIGMVISRVYGQGYLGHMEENYFVIDESHDVT